MKIQDLIALISLVLSIPGFFLIFVKGEFLIGILLLLLVLGLAIYYWHQKCPMVTQLEVSKVLTFKDAQASSASLEQTVKARANHKGLTEYWIGNLSADGRVTNICIDGKPPDLTETLIKDLRIGKRFNRAKKYWEEFSLHVTMDAVNCFPEKTEGLIHIVDHETRTLKIEVIFHEGKPVRQSWATLRLGAEVYDVSPPPEISENGRRLYFEVKNPRLSGHYFIEWNW
jgi:hypothetical protein